jgi:MYXO-CTERM domain-containing protein
VPNPRWGHGKLRILPALGLDPAPRDVNRPPELVAVPVADDAITLDVSATTDADGDTIRFSIDVGGDDVIELADADGPRLEVPAEPGTYTVIVRAWDGEGGQDGEIVEVTVLDEAPPEADTGIDTGGGNDAGAAENAGGGGGGCTTAPGPDRPLTALVALTGVALVRRRRT